MMNEELLEISNKIINKAEKLGAEWVEVRIQDTIFEQIQYLNNRLKESTYNRDVGVGIRLMIENKLGFASTSGLSIHDIEKTLEEAYKTARVSRTQINLSPIKPYKKRFKIDDYKYHPKDVEYKEKLNIVNELNNLVYEEFRNKKGSRYDKIETVNIRLGMYYGEHYISTSEGLEVISEEILNGLVASVVVRKEDKRGDAYTYIGSSRGLDKILDRDSISKIGRDAVKFALEKVSAKKAPSGYYPVITSPDVSGVFAHESFGHMSEGDYGASGASPLSNRLGEQIGSENAFIYDSGVPPNNQGFIYLVDSEGVPTKTVPLMEKGIFKGFMHSRETAADMNTESTGNGRAQDYSKPVIVRMRNTYFGGGDWDLEEMIKDIKEGIIAYDERGGQAELSGTFSFTASRGYYIKNGEIQYPVRDIVLSGNIFDMLKNIRGATKEIEINAIPFGGCGKEGQGVYVGLGGPYLYISTLNIGGG